MGTNNGCSKCDELGKLCPTCVLIKELASQEKQITELREENKEFRELTLRYKSKMMGRGQQIAEMKKQIQLMHDNGLGESWVDKMEEVRVELQSYQQAFAKAKGMLPEKWEYPFIHKGVECDCSLCSRTKLRNKTIDLCIPEFAKLVKENKEIDELLLDTTKFVGKLQTKNEELKEERNHYIGLIEHCEYLDKFRADIASRDKKIEELEKILYNMILVQKQKNYSKNIIK